MSYRIPSTSPDLNAEGYGAVANFDLAFGYQVPTASGAITIKEGNVFLGTAGVLNMTLALPTAGEQSAGGDDARELNIIATTAQDHTVTTPSNGINGADHVLTFGGAIADFVTLVAYNGGWIALAKTGVTLS